MSNDVFNTEQFTTGLRLLAALSLLGCGPGKATDEGDEATGGSESTSESESSDSDSTSESSSSESSSSESSDSDESDTFTFIPADAPPLPIGCDPWLQDCPDGEKCAPHSEDGATWTSTECVPVMGDQASGEPCQWDGLLEATDDCDASTLCWFFDGDGVGVCVPFCMGTADAPECDEGLSCLIGSEGIFALCISACDPLLQDCADDYACHWNGDDFQCVPPGDEIAVGEPCDVPDDCAPGLMCTAAEELPACDGPSCCTPFCELGDPDACDALAGTSCQQFIAPALPNLGSCVI